ncbi:MAG: glycosyltransferase family 2 protein [Candidatus Bathyarchaeota archaeon]|nr:glycosyltransferase family 2 protein [Candidatus Bathyarchaeota archaeon]
MSHSQLLSLIVPVRNEELTVGDIIERIQNVMAQVGLEYEVIVIDDCSTDKSRQNALKHEVAVCTLKEHCGKGYALRVGFKRAKGSIIITIDSDGSHRPEEIPQLLAPVLQGKADLVIGSRYLNQKNVKARCLNAFGVRIFNMLIKLLTGTAITDSQSGYRVMKREVLKRQNLKAQEYEIESEMLVQTAKQGFRIYEVPISFEQRTYGRSGVDPMVDGFKILLSIIIAYWRA